MERAELRAVQRELRRLITDPDGVEPGPRVDAIVRGEQPAERLAVYANAWFARLHDCLLDDFGALARALGPEAFHDLVRTYLMMHPPSRPSVHHAGAHLAEHLATEPFAEIFARVCPWAADLARLEWAMAEAFSAADAPALTREDLAACPDPGSLRLEPVPSLRLLECAWPVHEAREHHDADGDAAPASLHAAPTGVRVWRQDERVRYRAIPALEVEALRAAAAGEPFAAVCERVALATGEDAAARTAELLGTWISDGLLARPRP